MNTLRALRNICGGVIKHLSARIRRLRTLPAFLEGILITSVHGYLHVLWKEQIPQSPLLVFAAVARHKLRRTTSIVLAIRRLPRV